MYRLLFHSNRLMLLTGLLMSLIQACERINPECKLESLPLEFSYDSGDTGYLALDIDGDCVDDIVLFSSWSHALGCAMTDFSAHIGSLRPEVEIAAFKKSDSIFKSERIIVIEDTSDWAEGVYDTVYMVEQGTKINFENDYELVNVNTGYYPIPFDDPESVTSETLWLCDTLTLSSSYSSYCNYPYEGQYSSWSSHYQYGTWDNINYDLKKFIAISIQKGKRVRYYALEMSVTYSSDIILYQVVEVE